MGECRIVDAVCNGRMGSFTKFRFVEDINYGVFGGVPIKNTELWSVRIMLMCG